MTLMSLSRVRVSRVRVRTGTSGLPLSKSDEKQKLKTGELDAPYLCRRDFKIISQCSETIKPFSDCFRTANGKSKSSR